VKSLDSVWYYKDMKAIKLHTHRSVLALGMILSRKGGKMSDRRCRRPKDARQQKMLLNGN